MYENIRLLFMMKVNRAIVNQLINLDILRVKKKNATFWFRTP